VQPVVHSSADLGDLAAANVGVIAYQAGDMSMAKSSRQRGHSRTREAVMNRDRLDLAVAAQAMGTASSVVAALRLGGLAELERRRAELNPDSRARIEAEANEFDREGVEVVFLGEAGYPSRLAEIAGAPPLLYYRGKPDAT
jgi:predicted Rossmann fold nucleotide-binding protein DprA/Smf involved in DNA uptake